MAKFAENTTVPVEKSRAEIERLISKYRCTQFVTGVDYETRTARVQFRAHERFVRFEIKLPDPSSREYTRDRHGYLRSAGVVDKAVDQANRQRWRALLLVIKAKLEAVENSISTFEEEFLAHIVLPNQQTVADYILPAVAVMYETGRMPPERQLTAGSSDAEVIEQAQKGW